MPILKHRKQAGFVQIPNILAQSPDLSYEALGLLVNLLSRPDDWVVHKTNFITPKCGKTTLTRIFKELQDAGYLKMTYPRNEKGQLENLWIVSDEVMKQDEKQENVAEKPDSGKPDVRENRRSGNQTLQRNNITNKENTTNKKISISQHSVADKKKKDVVIDYSPDFETAWSYYPKRQGSNSKVAAWKHWKSRVNEGVSADDLITATRNYQLLLTNNGNIGTAYVMQAQRFYGANKEYEQFINIKQEDLSNEQQPDRKQTAREHHATICNIVNQLCEEAAKITGTV